MKSIEVVAAVIVKDGRIFATQRGYGDFKDFWEFPGGKIEPGEKAEDALIREIKEELEADITVESFLQTIEYDYPKFHLILHCYLCSLKNDTLHLLEHESAKWLSANELDSVEWLPADLSIIQKFEIDVLQIQL
ncbi:MAG: (deoxy)nucleoside triphosphate pyrophosphohydrolase [Bacteroidales bacterium]|nr:(deoxy)nucleoside triphosphate pyrophosphohydrolase [Bacteroidales bacterium]